MLAALLLLTGLPSAAATETGAEKTQYIIKIKESAGYPDDSPFRVVSEAEMQRLRDADLLLWYEPDGVMTFDDEPASDWFADGKWDLEMIGANAAFEAGYLGQGVRIGVIDSGINPHADLADRLVEGRSYLDDADETDTADHYGHGTLVAGLIAGSSEDGAIGAATGAELVPLKVTDGKAVMVSTVCRAIYGGIDDYGCDILNLSLGIRSDFEALREAVDYAEDRGVLVISAVGNNGTTALRYPAAYESVIGVGAVDREGALYAKSNYNESVFLTAPGVDVKTTNQFGGYGTATGTSFAVPHVTAAAAILKSASPELSTADVFRLLQGGAVDYGGEGWDAYYGHGIVNVEASLALLDAAPPDPPDPPDPPAPTVFDRIHACTQAEDCPAYAFDDLQPDCWYHDGVHFVLETGRMVGTGERRFSPDAPTTRAMLVTVLWRGESAPTAVSDCPPFPDVKDGAYYAEAVRWAQSAELVTGYPDGSFRPEQPVTREELGTVLFRYAAWKGMDTSGRAELSGFPDADAAAGYAAEALCWAVDAGLLRGTAEAGQLLLAPKQPAARVQLAMILYRFEE